MVLYFPLQGKYYITFLSKNVILLLFFPTEKRSNWVYIFPTSWYDIDCESKPQLTHLTDHNKKKEEILSWKETNHAGAAVPIDEKIQLHADRGEIVPSRAILKTPAQIEMIRKSADLNTAVLDEVAKHIRIGMSTAEIDEIVYRFTTEHGGIPAPLNYQGFPKSVCTSLNNEICHGIPDENIMIQDGDIINVDVSTILNGYFSDASRMFKMGNVSERAERLVRVTEECVKLGLEAAKPWGHLGDIADAINTHARANGYSVVEDIGGHGVGLEFHEDPFVSYVTPKGSEMLLVPGMMFTIEPMINEGSPDFFVDEDNDWTVYTIDDGLSAQIEYMVLVKEDGVEVLTK